jgi:hypothetical protein
MPRRLTLVVIPPCRRGDAYSRDRDVLPDKIRQVANRLLAFWEGRLTMTQTRDRRPKSIVSRVAPFCRR